MEEFENFVILTDCEWDKLNKDKKVFYDEKRRYAKGDIAYLDGEPWMSVKENTGLIRYPADPNWKKVCFAVI